MQIHTEKSKDVPLSDRSEKLQQDASIGFQDNRLEAGLQRKLQDTADYSPQAQNIHQFKAMAEDHALRTKSPVQKKSNNTGLPDNLKSGIENLSGYSMDDVKVHYNSNKPAQLKAHAYAQGTDIHIASGQEKHLPHEAWHVVQQKEGRVRPTLQLKGIHVNDNTSLEKEADLLGEMALKQSALPTEDKTLKSNANAGLGIIQKKEKLGEVAWDVTHEVLPDKDGSLFGDDSNPFENEGVELNKGDLILVDDELIFQSRRGSNQEVESRRKTDKEGHLKNKWLLLKGVKGKKVSGEGYIREETINIDKTGEKRLDIRTGRVDQETAAKDGDSIHHAWGEASKNRRMSTGAWDKWEKSRKEKGKDSSPSWDPIAEGYDVSKELSSSPKEEGAYIEVEEGSNQAIFTAYAGKTPIGIIIVEKWTTRDFPLHNDDGNKKWYLKWLVGHPTLKGAGGLLFTDVLKHVKSNGGTGMWVESAPSAVDWYKSKGFKGLDEQNQDEDFEDGWDSEMLFLDLI
jgi:hypothetical protein